MVTKRLTRKEIVQADTIQTTLHRLYEWSTLNAKWIVSVIVLVVLALFGSYLWHHYQQNRQTELRKEFAEALEIYHAPLTNEPETESDEGEDGYRFASASERHQEALPRFDSLARKYPTQRIGQLARYYVALNKRDLGQQQEAKEILKSLIEHSDQTEVKNLARYAQAQIARLDGHPEEAIRLLNEVLQAPWSDYPRQVILLELAQAYEAQGNPQEALKQYRRIVTDYSSSEYDAQAQLQISRLETQGE